ncbi:MAG: hypothetical protein QMC68_06030 [Bacteroidia bacterium]|jgi:hypothetical protein|tara:strand:- start:215 stop:400 length:186 start_codon:yes stop_codon:yes gene_type:complete
MKYILLILIIITGCSPKNIDDNYQNINDETELSDDLKAREMIKRDNERYDSMKKAQLTEQE